MTDVLIVAATPMETAYLRDVFAESETITVLHTGIGMVNTALVLGGYLAKHTPSCAINVGVAGSFDRAVALGDVLEVSADSFSELGAEDHQQFLTLAQMGFAAPQTFAASEAFPYAYASIRKVSGITVNTVHGNAETIAAVAARWQPVVETMEGAAFFQAMAMYDIPCRAFRGISNYVEPRNRAAWQLKEASDSVQKFVHRLLTNP